VVDLRVLPNRTVERMEEILESYNAEKLGWIIRDGSFIELGSKIGKNLETGHNVVIREKCIIGDDLKIWSNSVIDYECIIGNNVKIHCNCYVAQYTQIMDNVFLGPGVVVLNDLHPGCKYSRQCMRGPVIEEGVQVGGNSTILPFLRIGKSSLIGAGSVVTKDIPPFSVAIGAPARVVNSVYDLRCKKGLTDKPYKKDEMHISGR